MPAWAPPKRPFSSSTTARRGKQRFVDIDSVVDALSIPEALERLGCTLSHVELTHHRTECPITSCCSTTGFTWSADNTLWHCHSCGAGGSVVQLVMAAEGLDFKRAVGRAAQLAGVKPGAPPDAAATAIRRAAREKKRAEFEEERARRNNAAANEAFATFWRCRHRVDAGHSSGRVGRQYLASRGLGALTSLSLEFYNWITYSPTGEVMVPIWGFRDLDEIQNLAIRRITDTPHPITGYLPPKVRTLSGGDTLGTIGNWRGLTRIMPMGQEAPTRVALVEGVADQLSGVVMFPSDTLVIAANGADNLPKIVSALAAQPRVGARFLAMDLVLVPHNDGPGGAGERNHNLVLERCKELGKTNITTYDLRGRKDLNELLTLGPTP